jgi:uncharacterized membrane protein
MVGVRLPYYLYWYRFGHFVASLGGFETAEVYHSLIAFPQAFLISCLTYLFMHLCGIKFVVSTIFSLIIIWGSNLKGLLIFIKSVSGSDVLDWGRWWEASRVISGAITEFPSWSFILGDAHPHFMNQGMFLAYVLIITAVSKAQISVISKVLATTIVLFLALPFTFIANAWETPLVGLCFLSLSPVLSSQFIKSYKLIIHSQSSKLDLTKGVSFLTDIAIILSILLSLFVSIFLMAKAVPSGGTLLRQVTPPIAQTTVSELLLHWGVPLGLLILSIVALLPSRAEKVFAVLTLGLGFLASPALGLLLTVLVLLTRECTANWQKFSTSEQVISCLAVASLLLIIFPEIAFLDDPYGGENERMNTIFKVYSFTWPIFYFSAFAYLLRAGQKYHVQGLRSFQLLSSIALFTSSVLLCGFTISSALKVRKEGHEFSYSGEGLNRLEQEFPEARETIYKLRALPYPLVVAEADGGAYDWSTHIATLSHQQAYLGWSNHLGLLTKNYGEVERRTKILQTLYGSKSCEFKNNLAKEEHIDIIVFGPLEKKKYPAMTVAEFACFYPIYEGLNYSLYKVR